MALIDRDSKEIHLKVVYYGPSLSGKTTNIHRVRDEIQAKANETSGKTSDIISFPADLERTMVYEFWPVGIGQYRGMNTRIHLYSVPGQVALDGTRKLILRGVDGIIFVADSQYERLDENIESMKNLESNLRAMGQDIQRIPTVIQYNKRDLENAAPVAELRVALNRYSFPDFEATAHNGEGVMKTINTMTRLMTAKIKGG